MCLVQEVEALLEGDQKAPDDRAGPELLAVPLNIIELVTNVVST